MITSFLNSVDLPTVSGVGIAYEAGIANSSVLYNLPTTALGNTFTLVTLAVNGNTSQKIRINKSYSGQQLGFILQDRTSFLFNYVSGAPATANITAIANYYDNVGPVQRRLVQGYEA